MTKNQILRVAALLVVFICLVMLLSSIFRFEDSQSSARYTTYFNLPKNTVDVLLTGTSGIDRYWIAAKGYEEYGITAYPLSFDAMPAWLMVDIIKEALETQNPELLIFDMRGFTVTYTDQLHKYESPIHRTIDVMSPVSVNRFNAATKSAKIVGERVGWANFSALSFYLPFIKYHTRWSTPGFSIEAMQLEPSKYLGMFLEAGRSLAEIPLPQTEKTDEMIALDPTCEEALYELLAYLDGVDCEVLFLDTPKYLEETEYGRMNTLCNILDERGYKYKCFSAEDGTYNLYTDFYNLTHVNYKGAEKFTKVFAEYLKENYTLPDRREDKACEKDWNGVYEKILKKYESWVKKANTERLEAELRSENGASVISWAIPSPFDGYVIYRSEELEGEYAEIQIIEDGRASSYTDLTAEDGKMYYYMVRPFTRNDDSIEYGNYFEVKRAEP